MARKVTVSLGGAEYALTFDTHTKRPEIEKHYAGKKLWRVFVENIFGDTAESLLGFRPSVAKTIHEGDPDVLAYVLWIGLRHGKTDFFTLDDVRTAVQDYIVEHAEGTETVFDLALIVFDAALISGVFGVCFERLGGKKPEQEPSAAAAMGKGSEPISPASVVTSTPA